ncbi:MAG: NAD(+) diphosphatase [Wenzhouxiangellaceae bacterium]|nr:NAD(+) diphosphatase [Wenzhouxiangellaceae bacterium]
MMPTSSAGTHAAALFYADSDLDRAADRREDAAWLAAARQHPDCRVIALWRDSPAFDGQRPPRADPALLDDADQLAFLGIQDDCPVFAADFSSLPAEAARARVGSGFEDLRRLGPLLGAADAAVLAYARALLYWNRQHRWCGACGAPTESLRAGHMRKCSNDECARYHFPRTDPAVIMLVEHPNDDGRGPRCLLGHARRFPDGMYSTLAGFVEPGESLEQAVAREVLEESGVRIEPPCYFASQPWPFPGSVMLGFFARASSTEIVLEDDEISDARWFTPDELHQAGEWDSGAALCLPRGDSIARRLIEHWLARQTR